MAERTRLIACATSPVCYPHSNGSGEVRGWIASAKYLSLTMRTPVLSVGSGRTRDEAREDLVAQIMEHGIAEVYLGEQRDPFRRAFLLRQAYRLARYHGVEIEVLDDRS
jgi:hypothetical protein